MHERRALREAVKAQLVAGATSAGARVTESRQPPNKIAELPALAVYTTTETVAEDSMLTAPRELTRTVLLVVIGWVRVTADVEDRLDDLALEVETAMDSDLNFGACAYDSVLLSTEVDFDISGDRPMGAVILTYSAVYKTDLRVPAPQDDLETVDTRYSLSGVQAPADQAHDFVTDLEE